MDDNLAIARALLHDTLKNTAIRYADPHRDFGERVADAVQAKSSTWLYSKTNSWQTTCAASNGSRAGSRR